MDNLLEALKTGSAFNVNRDRKDARKRAPRAAGGLAECFIVVLLFSELLWVSHGIQIFHHVLLWYPRSYQNKVDFFSGICLFVGAFVNTITSERLNIG